MLDYFTSPEYRAAKDRQFYAECRLRCLLSALDRTPPEDFDALFARIMEARDEDLQARSAVFQIMLRGETERRG